MLESKTIEELIEYFLQEKRNGKGFSEIRSELVAMNVKEEDVKMILRLIDDEILNEEIVKSNKQKAKELIYIGAFIFLVGFIFTVSTFVGLIKMGDSFLLAYGPILAGAGVVYSGVRRYRSL